MVLEKLRLATDVIQTGYDDILYYRIEFILEFINQKII